MHLSDVQVDIEAEQALVLDLAVLSDHQDVLLCDQMVDAVRDLLCVFSSFLDARALTVFTHDLLNDLIDDVCLRRRLLAFSFKLFDGAYDKH